MAEAVKIEGLEELVKALRALPAEVASKRGGPVRLALRAAARVIRDDARVRAPRDTGRMARAIVTVNGRTNDPSKEVQQVSVRRGRNRKDPKGAYYYLMVELGTMGGAKPDQKPQPFLRPAAAAKRGDAIEEFKRSLAKGIKRAEAKVALKYNTNKAARRGG